MECLHRRLVNTTLSVAGWLTLTGLQSRQPPRWLWLLRLLPLTAYLLVLLCAVLLLASSPTEQQVVEGFSVYVFFLQTAVILVVFVMKRHELDGLDRQLKELGERAECQDPTTRRMILARIVFFVLVAAVNYLLWVVFPVVIGNFTHGNYHFQIKFPEFLETPDSYWFCMAFLILVVTLSCSLALAFDCCFFTWMNAVGFHLTAVTLTIERMGSSYSVKEAFRNTHGDNQGLTNMEFLDDQEETIFSIKSMQKKQGAGEQPRNSNVERTLDIKSASKVDMFLGKLTDEEETLSDFTDPVATLRAADQHYSQIARLVISINHLCGLPVLLTHAATMSNILFGLFACISLLMQPVISGQDVHIIGYFLYIFIFFMRITLYSYDGGSILEKNSALMYALVHMDWLGLPKAAKQQREILMQKVSQPLCISALGVFVINKINVLNICSFVLTYLVILMQMLNSMYMRPT